MANPSKLNCRFCLDGDFATIRVTILTNLTTIVSWWLDNMKYTVHPALWPGSHRQPETTAFILLR